MARGKNKRNKAARRNQGNKNQNSAAVVADNSQSAASNKTENQNTNGASKESAGGSASKEVAAGSESKQSAADKIYAGGDHDIQIFSFRKLQKAAQNFHRNADKGHGCFGTVYRACLKNDQVVAVKMLNIHGHQGDREFLSEILTLPSLRHPNIVRLIGFSAERVERLVVYEWMPLGSLDKHLFEECAVSQQLNWEKRITIAFGIAEALDYLHNKAVPQVIHGDLKPSDVLLDKNYQAKLSDFGSAKSGLQCGTAHDVYKFGELLVAVITGKNPEVISSPEVITLQNDGSLLEWLAKKMTGSGNLDKVVDSRLRKERRKRSLFKAASLAQACLDPTPGCRPIIERVLEELEKAVYEAISPTAGSD